MAACRLCVSGNLFVCLSLSLLLWIGLIHKSNMEGHVIRGVRGGAEVVEKLKRGRAWQGGREEKVMSGWTNDTDAVLFLLFFGV